MLAAVVAQLKTGSVKSVIAFGSEIPRQAPYDVVKPEKALAGRRFRIIAHRAPDEHLALEAHVREIIALLHGFEGTSQSGAINRLGYEGYTDVVAVSDDNTISMEASFTMPTRTF